MSTPLPAQGNDLIPNGERALLASGHGDNSPAVLSGEQAKIVAELIAQERVAEIFGLLKLVSDRARQEKLLAGLQLLAWYPPDPSESGIWREE